MAILQIFIDRITDAEATICKCYLDEVKINEDYFIDLTKTDEEIQNIIRNDLSNKGYLFE